MRYKVCPTSFICSILKILWSMPNEKIKCNVFLLIFDNLFLKSLYLRVDKSRIGVGFLDND